MLEYDSLAAQSVTRPLKVVLGIDISDDRSTRSSEPGCIVITLIAVNSAVMRQDLSRKQ